MKFIKFTRKTVDGYVYETYDAEKLICIKQRKISTCNYVLDFIFAGVNKEICVTEDLSSCSSEKAEEAYTEISKYNDLFHERWAHNFLSLLEELLADKMTKSIDVSNVKTLRLYEELEYAEDHLNEMLVD